jgi:hypothetical protein
VHVLTYVLTVLASAIAAVLVFGGATAGTYAGIGYLAARTRADLLGEPFARRIYRRGGVVLIVVGALCIIVTLPGLVLQGGPAGNLGTVLGGVAMVVLGRVVMVRFRAAAR